MCTDFLPTLNLADSQQHMSVSLKFGRQTADFNIALMAGGLLWQVLDLMYRKERLTGSE